MQKRTIAPAARPALALLLALGVSPARADSFELIGVADGSVIATLTTPALPPQPSAYFQSSNATPSGSGSNFINNGLKPNQGTPGAFQPNTATPTNSWFITVEGTVDQNLATTASQVEVALGSGDEHRLGLASEKQLVRRDEFEVELSGHELMSTNTIHYHMASLSVPSP